MWTSKNRARYDRSELRYPSDLTDDEWRLVEPLIPPGKTGGGKRAVIMRGVVNGLMSYAGPPLPGVPFSHPGPARGRRCPPASRPRKRLALVRPIASTAGQWLF